MTRHWVRNVALGLALSAGAASLAAAEVRPPAAVRADSVPDSKKMQNDLQQMSWPRFRSVIEAVPKLRAGVDAFGPAGWQFVKDNYQRYPWKSSIDKLDEAQKRQLAARIQQEKGRKR